MIDLPEAVLDELLQRYAVANTPTYLYKHFRQHPSVQGLAESHAASDLLEAASELGTTKTDNPGRTAAHLYALVIGATFRESREIAAARSEVGVIPGRWAEDILNHHEAVFIPTSKATTISLEFPVPSLSLSPGASVNAGNSSVSSGSLLVYK